MATALIQINTEVAGQSVLGLDGNTTVTLTDAGGPGATSYQWEFLQIPAPYVSPPLIVDNTSQVATVGPPVGGFTDGLYIVRLTRDDPVDGASIDTKYFGIPDADGNHLPVAGVNRNMSNVGGSAAAQDSGWFGSEIAGTNSLLDSFLRQRRANEERTFLVDTLGVEPYVPTIVNNAHQVLKLTGGTKTVSLPIAENNLKFTILDGIGDALANPITINPNAVETISGQPNTTLSLNYATVALIGEAGTGWFIY